MTEDVKSIFHKVQSFIKNNAFNRILVSMNLLQESFKIIQFVLEILEPVFVCPVILFDK